MVNSGSFDSVVEGTLGREGFTPIVIVGIIALILVVGMIGYFTVREKYLPGDVACTLEAKVCPDGSAVGRVGPNCEFAVCPPSKEVSAVNSTSTDTSSWKLYSNDEFGFSFKYPSTWQKSGDVLTVSNPHIFFGNPLNGATTYILKVFVTSNPQNLSATDFVKHMLTDDAARDAAASAQGPAPQMTPQFAEQYAVTVGTYSGYELYSVFEFDHQGEQIYVQQNKQMVMFDFPVANMNPSIANAAANNAIAHGMVSTLRLDPAIWKFCGGIAAFPCATGSACKLDGNFPDAGGHCVKS